MSNSENNSAADSRPAAANLAAGPLPILGLIAVIAVSLLVLFWDGIQQMVSQWDSPEYNHGYMIPFVALYLLWLRARALDAQTLSGSWFGVILLLFSLFLLFLGELSAVYAIIQYGFVLGMWAAVTAATGARGLKLLWVPLLYLAFMVPLPGFIATRMTAGLQLISSELGVAVIRAAGLSVFLEGNVIDLGTYKLQVAEACSGMRYMFPLLSFGYLCAVLFQGRWWQRAVLLVAVVPITILMNSFRIGVIGILVNFYGIEQAEGFLHDFEGWVVFMACVGILFLIIWIFARMERKGFLEIFGLDIPPVSDFTNLVVRSRPNRPTLVTAAVLVVAVLASLLVTRPPTLVPERQSLATFPLRIGDWQGREEVVEQMYLDVLKTSDELMVNFSRPGDPAPVNLWIAYYDSQAKGASVHSPQACLPGGGWQIESFGLHTVGNVGPGGEDLQVNRAVISLGEVRQVVYYWFEQRGRRLTNEFMVKWYIFQDGITMNRTDGALVRMTTFVPDPSLLPEAEGRLEDFIRATDPQLAYHLPGADAPVRADTALAAR